MAKIKRSLRDICREVGVPHLQVTEVLRRVDKAVREDNEVITQEVGTFYLRKSKARERVLNGERYAVPAREAVALRGRRFPGRIGPAVRFGVGDGLDHRNLLLFESNQNDEDRNRWNLEQRVTLSPFLLGEVDVIMRSIGEVTYVGTPGETNTWAFDTFLSVEIVESRLRNEPNDNWIMFYSGNLGMAVPVETGAVWTRELVGQSTGESVPGQNAFFILNNVPSTAGLRIGISIRVAIDDNGNVAL